MTVMESDILAGFSKAGIHPINRDKVLNMLPTEEPMNQNGEEVTDVNDSLVTFLREMRRNQPTKSRKKKLDVPAGRSICLEDLESEGSSVDEPDEVVEKEEENQSDEEPIVGEISSDSSVSVYDLSNQEIKEGHWVKVGKVSIQYRNKNLHRQSIGETFRRLVPRVIP
jgi:hypothetical protein